LDLLYSLNLDQSYEPKKQRKKLKIFYINFGHRLYLIYFGLLKSKHFSLYIFFPLKTFVSLVHLFITPILEIKV